MIGNEGEEGKSHTSATTAHDMLLQSPKPLCHLPPASIPDPTFFWQVPTVASSGQLGTNKEIARAATRQI